MILITFHIFRTIKVKANKNDLLIVLMVETKNILKNKKEKR